MVVHRKGCCFLMALWCEGQWEMEQVRNRRAIFLYTFLVVMMAFWFTDFFLWHELLFKFALMKTVVLWTSRWQQDCTVHHFGSVCSSCLMPSYVCLCPWCVLYSCIVCSLWVDHLVTVPYYTPNTGILLDTGAIEMPRLQSNNKSDASLTLHSYILITLDCILILPYWC